MRTTINIDNPILREVKKVAEKRGLTVGRVVSDLLADALHDVGRAAPQGGDSEPFRFITKRMGSLVDIDDVAAVLDAVDAADATTPRRPARLKKKNG